MKDVQEGAAIRPFFDNDVSKLVGDGDDDHGIPTLRFEVVQKSKVRGVDSATSNGINMATVRTQKLELPSTAANVAVIKWLRSQLPDQPLHKVGSWMRGEPIGRSRSRYRRPIGRGMWSV